MTDPQADLLEGDDDLFDFDELQRDAEQQINSDLESELEQALAVNENDPLFDSASEPEAEVTASPVTAPLPVSVPTVTDAHGTPESMGQVASAAQFAASAAARVAAQAAGELRGAAAIETARGAHQRGTGLLSNPRTQLILAGMVVLNLLLVGLSWRSQDSARTLLEQLDRAPQQTDSAAASTADTALESVRSLDTSRLPIDDPRPEGYETLDEAERALERGEFRAAREMLFALLSIIDRVEDSARYDVEARAAFMLGDSYRLEADALVRAANDATNARPGEQL